VGNRSENVAAQGRIIGTSRMRSSLFTRACALAAGLLIITGAGPAWALSLEDLLSEVLAKHDQVLGADAEVAAARERAREALGDWFPEFETTATHGHETIANPHGSDTGLPFSQVDVSLTQLLWDFGATNGTVEKARLELAESQLNLAKVRDDIFIEATNAYVDLIRARQVLSFSRQSQDNVRQQTGLEEARVETGSGLSTDVLQAKQQLAGADARTIGSEGTLISAQNRFKAVFGTLPKVEDLSPVPLPLGAFPATLDDAIDTALRNNREIAIEKVNEAVSRTEVKTAYGENFFPKLEGVVERKWKNNVSGTVDLKTETVAKVELNLPFNLGFTAVNTLRAAEYDVVVQTRTVADTIRRIKEEVRNAWQELHTAQKTARSLQTQADISAAFLELAREERKLGNRSLIDVLAGETTLINAQSDAVSAEADVILAAFNLLNLTGKLDQRLLKDVNGASEIENNHPAAGTTQRQNKRPADVSAAPSGAAARPPATGSTVHPVTNPSPSDENAVLVAPAGSGTKEPGAPVDQPTEAPGPSLSSSGQPTTRAAEPPEPTQAQKAGVSERVYDRYRQFDAGVRSVLESRAREQEAGGATPSR